MYRKALKVSIIFIYLIIVAGAVVRMTGSGMGCPDWPKCFGYYIPPTEEADLAFKPDHTYEGGAVIIRNDELRVATETFETGTNYNEANWSTYDKHEYASFNVWHTWIEYINRLVTVLAGIPILLMIIFAFWYWKGRPWLIFSSFFVLPLMGFQAWLGKEVVDSNLLPVKITIHMIVALLIVALMLFLWHKSQNKEMRITGSLSASTLSRKRNIAYDPTFKYLTIIAVLLTLVQVAFGTQVRQYVDERVAEVGYAAKSLWLEPATVMFYVHRSFSVVVVLLNVYMFYLNKTKFLGHRYMKWVLVFIGFEVLTGIMMYYVDFPFGSQPLHLVIASLLFGVQFYLMLQSLERKKSVLEALGTV